MTVHDQIPLVGYSLSSPRQETRARLIKLSHSRGTGDSQTVSAADEDHVLLLAERVQQILASHPPLTAEQRARIVALLG